MESYSVRVQYGYPFIKESSNWKKHISKIEHWVPQGKTNFVINLKLQGILGGSEWKNPFD